MVVVAPVGGRGLGRWAPVGGRGPGRWLCPWAEAVALGHGLATSVGIWFPVDAEMGDVFPW